MTRGLRLALCPAESHNFDCMILASLQPTDCTALMMRLHQLGLFQARLGSGRSSGAMLE